MKYMIMECHRSYAVALDEEGRFLRVANMHYQVGQMVEEIYEMRFPDTVSKSYSKRKTYRWMSAITALAACLVLMVTSVVNMGDALYGSIYMTINPEVRIDINRFDKVIAVEGLNEDGNALIEGYEYKKKDLDVVSDELVDRAIDMGFLSEGKTITISLDGENQDWQTTRGDELNHHLEGYLKEKLSVTITVEKYTPKNNQVTISAGSGNDKSDGETDYGDNGESNYSSGSSYDDEQGVSTYDDSDSPYGSSQDGGDSHYDSSTAGNSDYASTGSSDSPYDSVDDEIADSQYDSGDDIDDNNDDDDTDDNDTGASS